ncbi:hypothetical protein ACFQ44_03660 [Levilactobacillus lanxiensis]|uniref:LPXTG cell wall anchor domain-containing protein n=1 Tax=Levilactobacillus lanxiensis TaxID=2799568 RepID=A0ABW4CZP7_9LACO|nr:hypothetical protein [Levilactobacillus lanxiensis]
MATNAVHIPTIAYAASETAKQTLAGYIAKGKIILANKDVTGIARDVIVSDQSMATDAYNSGDQESYKQANKVLSEDYGVYDSKGSLVGKKDESTSESDADDMGDNVATAEEPGIGSSNSNSSSSDPIKDTQDAHEYEESTAQDENSGSHSTDSNTDSNGNSGSSTVNSSSTKPNSHSTSEFSKESVNAPGNAGSITGSSNTSRTTPDAKSQSKKGNLPGTGEDSNQTVLLATIGLLGILGLGGTALVLWLRQRTHVNNE